MLLLIIVALLVAIAVSALVCGTDSRDSLRSSEHELADRGMTW